MYYLINFDKYVLNLTLYLTSMKIALYIRNGELLSDGRYLALNSSLKASGFEVYRPVNNNSMQADTDIVLAIGGDGTFLSCVQLVRDSQVPVLGVNLGRLGFLSENRPETALDALLSGKYIIEDRALLKVDSCDIEWPYALNEVSVSRKGAAMLGVDVRIDGNLLPTYWADGLLVATSSGSTAYSLSVGGPIVMPESKVLIISPVAPHNLNVRPLVIPVTSKIELSFRAREASLNFTIDNRTYEIDSRKKVSVSLAQFSLKRVRLDDSNFINALTSKLYWGEDLRNTER